MTSGFYKLDNSGELLHGPNYVYMPNNITLLREHKDTYTYPVAGWIWCDSEEEAHHIFNIEPQQ